jgi:hypothetical protein
LQKSRNFYRSIDIIDIIDPDLEKIGLEPEVQVTWRHVIQLLLAVNEENVECLRVGLPTNYLACYKATLCWQPALHNVINVKIIKMTIGVHVVVNAGVLFVFIIVLVFKIAVFVVVDVIVINVNIDFIVNIDDTCGWLTTNSTRLSCCYMCHLRTRNEYGEFVNGCVCAVRRHTAHKGGEVDDNFEDITKCAIKFQSASVLVADDVITFEKGKGMLNSNTTSVTIDTSVNRYIDMSLCRCVDATVLCCERTLSG